VAPGDEKNGSGEGTPVPAGQAPEVGEEQGQAQGQEQGRDQGQEQDKAQAGRRGILPTKATEDDPRVWGDADEDHDAWLKEQKPPHWG
jgi:hypothetical protein